MARKRFVLLLQVFTAATSTKLTSASTAHEVREFPAITKTGPIVRLPRSILFATCGIE
jgi:hypothetical protein